MSPALVLVAALAALSPTPSGWNNTSWGMTAQQVQRLYPDVKPRPFPAGELELLTVSSVAGRQAVLCFHLEPHQGLTAVGIFFVRHGSYADLELFFEADPEGPVARKQTYQDVGSTLIDKYDFPTFVQDRSLTWVGAQTTINLTIDSEQGTSVVYFKTAWPQVQNGDKL